MTGMTRPRTAALLVLGVVLLASCGGGSHRADPAACEAVMKQQMKQAMADPSKPSQTTRPAACEGVSDADLQKFAGEAISAAASGATTSTEAATGSGVPSGYHRKCALGQAIDKCPIVRDSPTPTPAKTVAPAATKAAPAAKPPTVAQQQALDATQQYVDLQGFSRKGLLRQLTSKAGNGFSTADATWAVNHVKVDWNAEAVESAKSYLDMGGFSRSSLIKQLTSAYGDGFTKAQAQYAVKKVGL
jgi:hypothetical protein